MDSKRKILIVEDELDYRLSYEKVLDENGYEILTAEDVESGWKLIIEKKPDLVLLDLGLPKLNGLELLRLIRKEAATKAIPVLIFSMLGEQMMAKTAIEMGANVYALKGFHSPLEILKKVECLLMIQASMSGNSTSDISMKITLGDAAKWQEEIYSWQT